MEGLVIYFGMNILEWELVEGLSLMIGWNGN